MGKLVRDNIDTIIKNDGKEPIIKILNKEEYKVELIKKLEEEVREFIKDDNLEELADILEVVYALTEERGNTIEELNACRSVKAIRNGKFKDKKYLVEIK